MRSAASLAKSVNWRLVLRLVWLLVIAVVVYALLPTLTKMPAEARESLDRVRWSALAIGILLEFGAQVSGMLVLRRALQTLRQKPPSDNILMQVWFAQMAVAVLLPGGSVTATVMVADALRRRGVDAAEAATAATLSKALSIATLVALFVVGFGLSTGQANSSSDYVQGVIIGMPILIVAIGALVAAIIWPRIAGALAGGGAKLASRFAKKLDPKAIRQRAEEIARQSQQLLRGRNAWLTVAFSCGYWLLDTAVLYLMLWGLDQSPHIGAVLLASTVGRLLATIPITPGGIGIVEVAETAILAAFGTPSAIAALAVIAYRVISFWLVNLVGIGAAVSLHRSGVRVKQQTEPAAASGN
ncbi:MAG: flippase-like domain-containing protein [Actinobacteria bacterium]|uniref:Unannotated protein n=1 Tax=freshwater metagenome TaxID=449393 RepID=A0A6J5ZT60_9ZZZZ|nr:flippase-like domain-containing protein [Actinomycetota bacterium]